MLDIKNLIPLKVASKELGISYKTLYSWIKNKSNKPLAVTVDEKTGDITLVDLYFLGTNLDGAENYTEKIRFYPENNTLEYNGDYYFYSE